MTAGGGSAGWAAWFAPGSPGGPAPGAEQARRWRELAQAGRLFLHHVRAPWPQTAGPGVGREVAAGFWSPTPVLGFRLWRLSEDGLRGVRQVWPGPQLEARCGRRGGGAPHSDGACRCGIYALKGPEALLATERLWWLSGRATAYGLVALSGTVVEHERGYRAERATVLAVAVVVDGRVICGSHAGWVERLFRSPRAALAEAAAGRSRGVRVVDLSAEVVAQFLRDEARRQERGWTSGSRSE